MEKIAAAALRKGELILSIPPPARHHTIFWAADALGYPQMHYEQGFTTTTGRFVDREEGCSIAIAAGQIKEKTGPADILFSECMW